MCLKVCVNVCANVCLRRRARDETKKAPRSDQEETNKKNVCAKVCLNVCTKVCLNVCKCVLCVCCVCVVCVLCCVVLCVLCCVVCVLVSSWSLRGRVITHLIARNYALLRI